MFIERLHHPTIEWNQAAGQAEPVLVHYLSDRVEPFKTVLPRLIEGHAKGEDRVLVIASPLSQIVDATIRLHQHPDSGGMVVVDYEHWTYFEAVRESLLHAINKIDQIQYAALDDGEVDED